MATQTIEAELLDLEKRFWQAIKDRNVDAAVTLTDFPCIVTGAQGVGAIDQQTFTAMMKAAPYTMERFEIKEGAEVRLVRDDVAIVAYQVHEELTVEGEPVTLDAADSSTWVRRNGRWLCASHTESILGDPFGRDRRG
ncbi:MAG: nuclear transport factor 2 family protein [Gemmatimonadales bacterium]